MDEERNERNESRPTSHDDTPRHGLGRFTSGGLCNVKFETATSGGLCNVKVKTEIASGDKCNSA